MNVFTNKFLICTLVAMSFFMSFLINAEAAETNKSIGFIDNTSHVYIPKTSNNNPTEAITISIDAYYSDWSNTTGTRLSRMFSNTEQGGISMLFMGTNATLNTAPAGALRPPKSTIRILLNNGSEYYFVDFNYSQLSSGWHNFAMSYDGYTINFYVDGILVNSKTSSIKRSISYHSKMPWLIGAEPAASSNVNGYIVDTTSYGGNQSFTGNLDNFRIFNYALTDKQIDYLKDKNLVGNELGLVANYTFDTLVNGKYVDNTPFSNSATPFTLTTTDTFKPLYDYQSLDSAITDLRAIAYSGYTSLSWSMNDPNDLIVGYFVYVNGVKYNESPIVSTSLNVNVPINQTNTYYVVAVNKSTLLTEKSNEVTTYFDTVSPLAPIGLTINGLNEFVGNDNTILLKWTASTEIDLAGYNVYKLPSDKLNDDLLVVTSYEVSGLAENQTYKFAVTAVDTSDNESLKSNAVTWIYDTIPPNSPALSGTASDSQVSLNWTSISDAVMYKVYENGILIKELTTNNVVIDNMINDTKYNYQVTALDKAGNESELSNVLTLTPFEIKVVPDMPTDLSYVLRSGAIQIFWKASENATSYNVYLNGELYNLDPIKNTYTTIINLTNGDPYNFSVAAVNSVGESPLTAAINFKTTSDLLPYITYTYSLDDVATGMASWFKNLWLIISFVIAIPLAFYIANRIKTLF